MSGLDVLAVVVFFLIGYWVVSALWDKLRAKASTSRGQDQSANTAQEVQPEAAAESWHEVLLVRPDASIEEIKSAYRTAISKYHPDKVAEMGPELREIANKMSQRINRAYHAALSARQGR